VTDSEDKITPIVAGAFFFCLVGDTNHIGSSNYFHMPVLYDLQACKGERFVHLVENSRYCSQMLLILDTRRLI